MDKLTPQLNDNQLKQNIDALQKQGMPQPKIQEYVDQYMKSPNGGYSLKSHAAPQDDILNKVSNAVDNTGNILGDIAKKAIQAPVTLATRAGQLAGVGIAHALPKYFDPAKADQAANQPMKVPGLGNDIKPISQETPESLTGEAASTVALGAGPTLGGALGSGGYAMQENKSPLSVAGYTAAGGLGGYLLGKATGVLSKAVTPRNPINDSLISSGAAVDVEAPSITQTLQKAGIHSISSPTERAVANNVLDNTIRNVQELINNATPDTISGQFSPAVTDLQQNLQNLLVAQRAIQQVSRVPIPESAGPGIMSRVLHGAGHLAGKAATGAGLLGGGYFVGKALQGNSPANVTRKVFSGGTLNGQ